MAFLIYFEFDLPIFFYYNINIRNKYNTIISPKHIKLVTRDITINY